MFDDWYVGRSSASPSIRAGEESLNRASQNGTRAARRLRTCKSAVRHCRGRRAGNTSADARTAPPDDGPAAPGRTTQHGASREAARHHSNQRRYYRTTTRTIRRNRHRRERGAGPFSGCSAGTGRSGTPLWRSCQVPAPSAAGVMSNGMAWCSRLPDSSEFPDHHPAEPVTQPA